MLPGRMPDQAKRLATQIDAHISHLAFWKRKGWVSPDQLERLKQIL